MELRQKKWDEEAFLQVAQREMGLWPTGKEIDLEEAIEYQKTIPDERNAVKAYMKGYEEGRTLIVACTGMAIPEHQIEFLQYVGREADAFIFILDSFSRHARFKESDDGLKKSLATGKSLLNGFPLVPHGVRTSRAVIGSVNRPIWVPVTGSHSEFSSLMAVAAGATQLGVNIFDDITQDARIPLEQVILCGQFHARLVGYLEERGVSIGIRDLTIGTGVVCPPSIMIAASIINCLMCVAQGAKYVGTLWPVNDCLLQDLVALKVSPKLHESYLKQFGYHEASKATLSLGPGTTMTTAAFPNDRSQAFAKGMYETMIAGYARATHYHIKTAEEPFGIPTKETTAEAVRAVRYICNTLRNQRFPETSKEFELEARMIEMETRAIVDKVLEVGDGDVVVGIVKAIEQGLFDIPYAVGTVAGKCLAIRDVNAAVRFLDCGNLPFSNEIVAFHQEKVAERKKQEGQSDWEIIAKDLRGDA